MHSPSNERKNNPRPMGKFGKKASSLDQKLSFLENRIQELQEQATNTTYKIKHLSNITYKAQLKINKFERMLLPDENVCRPISLASSSHKLNAEPEIKKSISPPQKDFSSFLAGASVIEDLTSLTWSYHRKIRSSKLTFYEKFEKISGSPPVTALASDLSIGTCWPFHQTTGQIAIRLSRTIWVEGIIICHVLRSLAYDIQTAPKKFELWGLDRLRPNGEGSLLVEGTYSISSSENTQYFPVPQTKSKVYSEVLLKITSNHGNLDFTCIYRVQVHGKLESEAQGHDQERLTPT
ncbi:hypothetical protein PTTG_03232 [Puccinia triticina 1-1 BBBD Race 1]|uniref:SUN domain-containing protein n=1 Tax=Puccinia triticina (isolate 1-1 / race 1 (BBBD)) TaxID=630390 RepID=A0A180GTW2_PUCT1|nr:hypothetical protein PTTG_03232 [Puccinia triticina 1-1 BBBD Race 1]WAR58898.1 hypothetical protein PtB15_10B237 [Puccinia triticina]